MLGLIQHPRPLLTLLSVRKRALNPQHASMYKSRALFAYIHFFQYLLPVHPCWLLLDGKCFKTNILGPRSVQEYSTFSPLACYKTRRLWTEPTVRSEGQPAQGIPKVLWKRSSIPKKDLDPLESFLVAFQRSPFACSFPCFWPATRTQDEGLISILQISSADRCKKWTCEKQSKSNLQVDGWQLLESAFWTGGLTAIDDDWFSHTCHTRTISCLKLTICGALVCACLHQAAVV